MKKTSKVIVPHSATCFMANRKNPWSGLLDKETPYFYGNAYANDKAKYTHTVWYRMTCNDPNCPAIKAVNSSVIRNA